MSGAPVPHEPTVAQRFAWLLGVAGLLPFFSHALFAWITSPDEIAAVLRSQAHYTAAILTFVGALHWGVVVASPSIDGSAAGRRMVWSVVPALWSWIVGLYPVTLSLPLLFAGLAVALPVDWLLYRAAPVPRWFVTLRVVLSAGALACVGASWLAMLARMPVR